MNKSPLILAVLTVIVSACSQGTDPCGNILRIEGTENADQLQGDSAGECLFGLGGNDLIDGGAGNDVINGGDGSDFLHGGEGDDTYVVNLGDKMDLIADADGDDTIVFASDISLSSIAAKPSPGLLLVQIEQDQQWTYLMVESRDELSIEGFILPGGNEVSGDEFLEAVSNDVLSIQAFREKMVIDATVPVAGTNPQGELRLAVTDSLRNNLSQGLCIRPANYPRPDQLGKQNGIIRPDENFAVFFGPPNDEPSVTQRSQYRALADVGVMSVEPVSSANGEAGEKFQLTVDGWAFSDRMGCIHYAELDLRRVVSYLPTGRKMNGAEVFRVKADVGAINVQLWAKEPAVRQAFPDIADFVDGKTIDAIVLKGADGWTGSTGSGYPISRRKSSGIPTPSHKALLAMPHIDALGTLKSRDLCVRLPMLAFGQYDHKGYPYVTSVPEPYRGGAPARTRETREYLDMLVNFGVVRSGDGVRTSPSSDEAYKVFEYRFLPGIRLADGRSKGAKCLPVASLEFDLVNARRVNNRILIRGIQSATASYPWVLNPAFLAAHPEVGKALKQPQPAIAEVRMADDGSLKMNYWTIPN